MQEKGGPDESGEGKSQEDSSRGARPPIDNPGLWMTEC